MSSRSNPTLTAWLLRELEHVREMPGETEEQRIARAESLAAALRARSARLRIVLAQSR